MRWFALVGALAAGLALAAVAPSARAAACADWPAWLAPGCETIADTWNNGRDGLLISGYAWHLPFSWTAERRRELNADAWGVGYYRTTEDAKGDSRSLFLAAFSDSHKHPQWNLGYEYSTYWGPRSGVQAGLGYTALVDPTARHFQRLPVSRGAAARVTALPRRYGVHDLHPDAERWRQPRQHAVRVRPHTPEVSAGPQ